MPSFTFAPFINTNPSPFCPSSSTTVGSSLLPRSPGKVENPLSLDVSKSADLSLSLRSPSLGRLIGYKEITFSGSWVSEYPLIMVYYEHMEDCLKLHQSPPFCWRKMGLESGQW
ncbi:hypothetical protein AMTRI_Chr12g272360 [Amborella trichopoda]